MALGGTAPDVRGWGAPQALPQPPQASPTHAMPVTSKQVTIENVRTTNFSWEDQIKTVWATVTNERCRPLATLGLTLVDRALRAQLEVPAGGASLPDQ